MNHAQVCILGGGITGALAACMLRDAGCDVIIVDRYGSVMDGASRWNEGKVHLGFTYTGVADLTTARLMIAGAAEFESILHQVVGSPLRDEWWTEPVVYLVDKRSIFPVETLWNRAQATAALIEQMASERPALHKHLRDTPLLCKLPLDDAMQMTGQRGVSGAWRTAERAVAPRPVAAQVRGAVSERGVPVVAGDVIGVSANRRGWEVTLADGERIASRVVVNALWESREAIDRTARLAPAEQARPAGIIIRYKVGIFATEAAGWSSVAPSTRILGKFGDITPYGNGDLYLSWYPAALIGRSDNGIPPRAPALTGNEDAMRNAIFEGLALRQELRSTLNGNAVIRGGFVVAHGSGDISEPTSSLHHRMYPDARELAPGYVSADTGKYTLGPLMARRAAECVLQRIRQT